MPGNDTYKYCEKHLFSDVDVMRRDKVPEAVISRIVRIRDLYSQWLQTPSLSDRAVVLRLCSSYGIRKSMAYEDVRLIKMLLGNINRASKDFHRWRVNAMIERAYAIAEQRKDTRGMNAASMAYIKANNLDKADSNDINWDEILVQPFDITENPEVLGIRRVPGIQEKIRRMKEKYFNEDIEDVKYEEVDLNEGLFRERAEE